MNKSIAIIRVFLLGLFLYSCNNDPATDKKIFHYNQTTGLETTDPAFARSQAIMWIDHQLYNTLIEVDENMNLQASLAEKWEIAEDSRSIVFHIRQDVYFHDDPCFGGKRRKLTARDVEYSLSRIMDPETASNGAWIFNDRVADNRPFEALNDSTFILRLKEAFQPMLYILTMQYCSIVPQEAVEKYGLDFRNHPVGTGPFQLETWEEGIGMTLIKNLSYWEKDKSGARLPYIDGISISFVDNKASEFLLFKQGKIDFMNSVDPSFKDVALYKNGALKQDYFPDSRLYKKPYLNTEYFGFMLDTSQPNFEKAIGYKEFRQACNYGVDRKGLIQYMRNGIGLPAENGMIPPSLPGYDSSVIGYDYNPDKARQLLATARDKGLNEFKVRLSCPDIYLDYANFVANNLEDVGIHIAIDVVHQSLLREEMIKSQTPFFRASWIADYPDAESYLTLFYGPNPAPPNYTRYENPEYDRIYNTAIQNPDVTSRVAQYKKLNTMAMQDAPVLYLFYDEVVHFVKKKIRGWQINSLNLLELRYIDWD